MADRLKDETDTALDSLFRSESVRDDGFSVRVVARVRRQMWVQRLSLPVAFVIGAVLSAKPLIQFANALPDLLGSVPAVGLSLERLSISSLPQTSTIIMGVMLLATALMASGMLEE